MFHTRTGLVSGVLFLFALATQPMTASANGPSVAVTQTQSVLPSSISTQKAFFPQEKHFDELRDESKILLSEAKQWAKDQTIHKDFGALMDEMEHATDRLQDRVSPAGHALKKTLKTKLPGTSLVHFADRTFSVFGLILMMAFALVIFLMGLSNPISRLGGRH